MPSSDYDFCPNNYFEVIVKLNDLSSAVLFILTASLCIVVSSTMMEALLHED